MKCTLSVVLVLVGCAPTSSTVRDSEPYRDAKPERYTKLNESPRPMKARAPSSVTLYRTKAPEDRYVEVGEMVDLGDDETEALEKLKLSAAGTGCDGLIIGNARAELNRNLGDTLRQVNLSGTCIVFVEDPGTWRPSEDICTAGREKLFAAKDPNERAAIARSMPPECHRD